MTDDAESLAGRVKEAYGVKKPALLEELTSKLELSADKPTEGEICKGVYPSSARRSPDDLAATEPRLSILNSSFNSSSHAENVASVMVLPDFKIVHEVAETKEGAEELVESFLRGNLGRAAAASRTSTIRSWWVLRFSVKERELMCASTGRFLIARWCCFAGAFFLLLAVLLLVEPFRSQPQAT